MERLREHRCLIAGPIGHFGIKIGSIWLIDRGSEPFRDTGDDMQKVEGAGSAVGVDGANVPLRSVCCPHQGDLVVVNGDRHTIGIGEVKILAVSIFGAQ